jgi:fructokinase
VTLGPDGSLALVGDRLIRTPAPKIVAVDSTGAGDAFRGGLIAAWLESDGTGRPEELLVFANAVAAVSCTARGAMAGLPDRAAVARVTGGAAGQSK